MAIGCTAGGFLVFRVGAPRMGNAVLWSLAATVSLIPQWGVAGGESARWLLAGKQHLAEGRFEKAIPCLDQAIAAKPGDGTAFRCRAFARLLSGDPAGAIRDFDVALERCREKAVLYYGRAAARRWLGRPKEALADLSEALRLDPKYAAAFLARAEVWSELGDWHGSLEDGLSAAAVEGDPRDGDAVSANGQPDFRDLAGGKRVDLDAFAAYRAWSLLFQGERRQIPVEWFDAAGLSRNAKARSLREAARRAAKERRFDTAIKYIEQAIKLRSDDPANHWVQAAISVVAGDVPRALQAMDKVVGLDPEDVEAYRFRSQMYAESGEHASAAREMRAAEEALERRRQRAQGDTPPRRDSKH